MKKIPLGHYALIDDDDYELVSEYDWREDEMGYPWASIDGKRTRLHNLLLGHHSRSGDVVIDHINRIPSDNRRTNLRLTTRSINCLNTSKTRGKSKYKGAGWSETHRKWIANYRGKYLGIFISDVDAALAYDRAARDHLGDEAIVNFESEPPDNVDVPLRGVIARWGSSKFRGVQLNKQTGWWIATTTPKGFRLHLGSFDNEYAAARAYDLAVYLIRKDNAIVNFPNLPIDHEAIEPKLLVKVNRVVKELHNE